MNVFSLLGSTALALAAAYGPALAATVYIAEGSANDVLVVDGDTGKAIKRIPDLEAVHGLGGAPGVKYLVAGSFTEVSRANAQVPAKPEGVSADEHLKHHMKPDAAALPKDAGTSVLTILDARTGAPVRRIDVPGAVHHVAVSSDGHWAVATQPGADGISIINLETLAFVKFLPTGAQPNYAVFSPNGGTVYVTNAGNGTISEVDIAKGFVKRNFLAGQTPEHIVRSADGKTLYVADANAGNILQISATTGEITRSFPIGGEIHGLGLSDDEKSLFVSGKGENKIAAIDLVSGTVRSKSLAPAPYHLAVIPGTDKLFVSSHDAPKVWIVDQADLLAKDEIKIEGEGHQMVVLP